MHAKQRSLVRPSMTYLHHDLVALITRRRRLRLWIGRTVAMAGILAVVVACLNSIDISMPVRQINAPNEINVAMNLAKSLTVHIRW